MLSNKHMQVTFLLSVQREREREGGLSLKLLTMELMLKYFFLACRVLYARYLSQYSLEVRALSVEDKTDLFSGAFVCRLHEGCWIAVSGYHFGQQTAIKIGKGAITGMTLPNSCVSGWAPFRSRGLCILG